MKKKLLITTAIFLACSAQFEDKTKVNNFLQIAQLFFAQIAKIFLPLHHGEEKI